MRAATAVPHSSVTHEAAARSARADHLAPRRRSAIVTQRNWHSKARAAISPIIYSSPMARSLLVGNTERSVLGMHSHRPDNRDLSGMDAAA